MFTHVAMHLASNSLDLHAITAAAWFPSFLIGFFLGLYAKKWF